ncbi:hypothetical protein [Phenylobacterium sp.]|uniref:hypothetical protein n=1 Tax=Phenylobacterium sp. TaxID=1871053 RepID=UPI003BA9CC7F
MIGAWWLRCLSGLALAAALTVASTADAASLIGEQVHLKHWFGSTEYGEAFPTVTADADDTAFVEVGLTHVGQQSYPAGYNVDLGANSISVRLVFVGLNSAWSWGSPNGLRLTSDRLDISQMLATLSVESFGGFGFTADRVFQYDTNTVMFDFQHLPASSEIGFMATWENPSPTPESGMWVLMLAGFAACGAILRKRQNVRAACPSVGTTTPSMVASSA